MARLGRLELLVMAFVGFVGILDTSFMIPIIALYAESLGASKAEAGFIAGFYSMVAIPASIVAGILVDRLGRKKMLVAGLLWDAVSVFLYSIVVSSSQLLAVRGLHAIGGSLVYPAFIARAREISGERVGYSIGRLLAPVALAIALGTASAGFITYMLGYRIPFIALSSIILLAGILALKLPERHEEKSWRGLRGVAEGIREAGSSAASGLWLGS
ncbi:MAG: MFS transporter [Acidilobaceae archaeon]